ncbi:MAG: HNH endonuclease [Burkholderiales bacterium]|nr:HNH endonuclease [Burkholderiales bacterium]
MSENIISHNEMCHREGVSLQRGMNYGLGGNHSVILMSVRPNAPYRDRLEDGGTTLVYEGHDHPKGVTCLNPKLVDQPESYPSGKLMQNGKFHQAAQLFKQGNRGPERVRVYEKIRSGIWSYNGIFHLVDSWRERDANRTVFKFRLIAVEGEENFEQPARIDADRRRIIPTHVKLEVWKRDGGKCSICGAKDELHFDHILPFSKGGTSLATQNVQILCARHNLQKHDRIE